MKAEEPASTRPRAAAARPVADGGGGHREQQERGDGRRRRGVAPRDVREGDAGKEGYRDMPSVAYKQPKLNLHLLLIRTTELAPSISQHYYLSKCGIS